MLSSTHDDNMGLNVKTKLNHLMNQEKKKVKDPPIE